MGNTALMPAPAAPLAVVPAESENYDVRTTALVFNDAALDRMARVADMMAGAALTVPAHLRGKPGDCLAIVMQAMQWGMNPYAVAQKTHFVNGAIGYEAQLVNAVVQASGAIKGQFQYDYRGEKGNIECRVGAVLRGGTEITWGEWLSEAQVTTKNSPLWKTNPKQQLGYLQVKNWARHYTPGAILGVYTPDEIEELSPPPERDMGAAEVVQPATRTDSVKERLRGSAKQEPAKPASALDEAKEAIAKCKTLAELEAVKSGESFGRWAELSEADMKVAKGEYTARKKALSARPATTIDSDTGEIVTQSADNQAPSVTYAALMDSFNLAKTLDELDTAATAIGAFPVDQQKELSDAYKARRAELEAQ